jgi:hypothetical protein
MLEDNTVSSNTLFVDITHRAFNIWSGIIACFQHVTRMAISENNGEPIDISIVKLIQAYGQIAATIRIR